MSASLAAIFASPHLVDVILVFTLIEAAAVWVWLRRPSGSGPGHSQAGAIRGVGLMLLPGICLMLALRAALAGAAWPWVPAALAAALVAHLLDLQNRLRG